MPNIHVTEIDAQSPTFSSAAMLFDRYRRFYGQPTDLALAHAFLSARLKAGESSVLLARVNDQWIGFCQLYRGFSSIACAQTVVLNDLYVEASHRSIGVGRALIARAQVLAKHEGARSLLLETAETNTRAQALYESMGFERSRGFVSYCLSLEPTGASA
jgi:ribosomal protein S18 acetylase RimI-like enzyme